MNTFRAPAIGVLVLAGLPAFALAQSRAEVQDAAGLFHPDTIAAVNQTLQGIEEKYHRDVLIETVKELTPEEHKNLAGLARSKLGRAFVHLGETLAQEKDINGVYVLISADPSYPFVQVTVWPPEDPAINRFVANRARHAFLDGQKHAGPDQALFDMVDRLQAGFRGPLVLSALWWTLLALVGVFVLIWITALGIRSKLPTAPPQGTELVKILPGVLGGMFGSMAAHWIYDRPFQQWTEPQPQSTNGPLVTSGFPLPLGNPPPSPSEGNHSSHNSPPPKTEAFIATEMKPKDELEPHS